MSQTMDVIDYIYNKGSITAKQAMEDLGCFRLSGRIYDIKRMGIEVEKEMITVQNRHGKDCRVAKYTIRKSSDYSVTA